MFCFSFTICLCACIPYTQSPLAVGLCFSRWVTIIPTRLYLMSFLSSENVNLTIFCSKFILNIICSHYKGEAELNLHLVCIYSILDTGKRFCIVFFVCSFDCWQSYWWGNPCRVAEEVSQTSLMLDMTLYSVLLCSHLLKGDL